MPEAPRGVAGLWTICNSSQVVGVYAQLCALAKN